MSHTKNNVATSIDNGFTLTELLAAIIIIGILGSIAIPNYLRQMQKTRQSEAIATISQLQMTIVGYVDENGIHPRSWKELNEITAIITPTGPTTQNDFGWLTMASSDCNTTNKNCYEVKITRNIDSYILEATSLKENSANYNVFACIDIKTGASDLRKGKSSKAAQKGDLQCI